MGLVPKQGGKKILTSISSHVLLELPFMKDPKSGGRRPFKEGQGKSSL
jgi:hypothetical protein